jgi:hypothetical protein
MSAFPSIKAMLICDNIITEALSGKKSLIGVFEKIGAQKFPFTHFSLGLYVNFTDALGKYEFKLELFDVEKQEAIATAKIPEANISDKLGTGELVFNLKGLKFSHPGRYEFRIFANNRLLGTKSFGVEEVKPPEGQNKTEIA